MKKTIQKIEPPRTNLGHEITEVRKVPWDELWHIVYKSSDGRIDHNRVAKKNALEVAERL